MDDHGYDAVSSGHWGTNARFYTTPQRYQLQLCRLPDWQQQHAYTDRFSSSSFADSESEEEMSKRLANRAMAVAPPRSPPKARRGGTSHCGGIVHSHYHPYALDKQRGQMPVVTGRSGKQHLHFSHSSSDDDVFLDPKPPRPRSNPPHFSRRPAPYSRDQDRYVIHPNIEYLHPDNVPQQHLQCEQSRFEDVAPVCRQRNRVRERHHSMPPRGRDSSRGHEMSRGHEQFRGRDLSRGRELSRGHWGRFQERAFVDKPASLPSSGESSDDGSLRPTISASEELDYGCRHGGYPSSLGSSSRDSKTSSGSSLSNTPGSGGATPGRGRNVGTHRGGYPFYRSTGGQQNGMSQWRAAPQQGGTGYWGHYHQNLNNSPGLQNGTKYHHYHHHPPPTRAGHPLHLNPGGYGLGHRELIKPLVDPSTMTLAEKLHRFMLFVRHEGSNRVNDIQTIENAITGCHLDLKTLYEAEDVGVYQGRHTFSGKLSLSGVFLARAVGQVKRELKHECYKLALQVLRSKTVTEILKQHDIGIEAIRQKFEECSAADGNDASVSEAVVNLASAAPIAVAMETVATTEERWQDFVSYLKGLNPDMGNTISRIELAISGSRCGLERVYTDTPVMDPFQGKPGFQGSLNLGGVLQAQGQGCKKKEAKQRTYDLAYHRFASMDQLHIIKGVQPQNVEELKRERTTPVVLKEICTAEHIKKFEVFIDRIKDSSVREGPVTLLDLTANQLQLLITCMYRRVEEGREGVSTLCQLFVGDILISEGEGRQKKESQADAYSKAYEILISTPVETLISESHRLNKEELQGADVHDVVVKGQIKKEESNLPRLRQQFTNLEEALSEKTGEGMVVVEHQDWVNDRRRHAFCILQTSALLNVMLLKWCTEIETGFFTCRVQLQGQEVGVAKAHSRQQARNLASADALFKMYETQPVLRILNVDQSGNWVTYDQLLDRMGKMGEEEFKEVDEEWNNFLLNKQAAAMAKSDDRDDESSSGDNLDLSQQQKEEGKAERHLRVAAVRVAEEFRQRGDILEEVVFAPDIPHSVRRHLAAAVSRMGLRSTQCQKDGKIYLALQFRARVDKVVEEMKARGLTKTSRFELVEDRSTLPCHSDIAEEIAIARTVSRQDRLAARTTAFHAKPQPQDDKESRDAATGNSLNGSLFEETMEGFVTARSYLINDANASLHPPKVQSTPAKNTASSPPGKKAVTPAEQVYTRFARAMMASGIGQTLVPMECSTPVSNILVNPPQSDNDSGVTAPVIKNILVSPPQGKGLSMTLSSPMKNLSLLSSAITVSSSSFPQPDFSVSPQNKEKSQASVESSSCCSTLSPKSVPSSSQTSPAVSGPTSSLPQPATCLVPPPTTRQALAKEKGSSPPVLAPSSCITLGLRSSGVAANRRVPASEGAESYGQSSLQSNKHLHLGYPHSSSSADYTNGNLASVPPSTNYTQSSSTTQGPLFQFPHSSKPDYAHGGFYGSLYPSGGGGGAWRPQQAWTDPSAPLAIQMSPALSQCAGYGSATSTVYVPTKAPGCFTTAMYMENEVPSQALQGRRWNH